MACEISSGRTEPCKTVGGLKAIYLVNWIDGLDYSVESDDMIDSFGTDGPINAYKYELRGANSFDEAGETSSDNGSVFYTTTGTVQLKKQDAVTRKELKVLAYGRPRVITEGWDGSFKLYGADNGCDVSVSTASGAGMGDFTGYNLSITAKEVEPAYFIQNSVMDDVSEVVIVA